MDFPNCSFAALSSISVAATTLHPYALHLEQLFYVDIVETYFSLYWLCFIIHS